MYLQAEFPKVMVHTGGCIEVDWGPHIPSLEGFEELSAEEQEIQKTCQWEDQLALIKGVACLS